MSQIGPGSTRRRCGQQDAAQLLAPARRASSVRLLARRAFGEQTPLDIVIAMIVGSNSSRTLTGERTMRRAGVSPGDLEESMRL
jgi:hypothetical protein